MTSTDVHNAEVFMKSGKVIKVDDVIKDEVGVYPIFGWLSMENRAGETYSFDLSEVHCIKRSILRSSARELLASSTTG